ncbi:hypothetical protein FM104_14635 [Microbacterium esteraromaticum]|uniref:Uncharacterized protein n=1 Tax=Microbacterium esteraromaticum TaxID=57043 RepID=A0A1R4KQ11_9MICO|nr:hypothetical protein [Microbacterium esteraromaticum]SJN46173.1 hypothetical protein FM104_14635 [Microbacterium esteraromaticum]
MTGERGIQLDLETAERQVKLLERCQQKLDESVEQMEELRVGQTEQVWTADGKSVDLAAKLTAKYLAGREQLNAIQKDIAEAHENLKLAIEETRLLDEEQKRAFAAMLKTINLGFPIKLSPF